MMDHLERCRESGRNGLPPFLILPRRCLFYRRYPHSLSAKTLWGGIRANRKVPPERAEKIAAKMIVWCPGFVGKPPVDAGSEPPETQRPCDLAGLWKPIRVSSRVLKKLSKWLQWACEFQVRCVVDTSETCLGVPSPSCHGGSDQESSIAGRAASSRVIASFDERFPACFALYVYTTQARTS